jgi:hypothetical protein
MCKRTENIRSALREMLKQHDGVSDVAAKLGVVPAHINNAFRRENPSPTLDKALVRAGRIEPLPTRTRLAIDCTADTRQRFRDEAARRGMSGEAYLLYMMEVGG